MQADSRWEGDHEAERLALMRGALGYVGNDEYGSGTSFRLQTSSNLAQTS
jgi:hypothetical protein